MIPWEKLERAVAPDGTALELRRRGHEYLIVAGGYDLMSSEDDVSSRALAEFGCSDLPVGPVLVGGLGMGFTAAAVLEHTKSGTEVEVAEMSSAVVEWNRQYLGDLASRPLDNPRVSLVVGDVRQPIARANKRYAAVLLDVDNGPDALAHRANDALYTSAGVAAAWRALVPRGVFAVWSFSDDPSFTRRLEKQGFSAALHRVSASRKGRGRYHYVWVARRP